MKSIVLILFLIITSSCNKKSGCVECESKFYINKQYDTIVYNCESDAVNNITNLHGNNVWNDGVILPLIGYDSVSQDKFYDTVLFRCKK